MLKNVNVDTMCRSFEDELQKIATAKGSGKGSVAVPLIAGAVGYEAIRRANQDRKLGRQVRIQNQQY